MSSATMSSKLSYQASAYPTSYSQNVSSYQPGLSNGRQSSISVSENTIMNIPTLASVFKSTSSALEKAHKSLLSPPLNFLGGYVLSYKFIILLFSVLLQTYNIFLKKIWKNLFFNFISVDVIDLLVLL